MNNKINKLNNNIKNSLNKVENLDFSDLNYLLDIPNSEKVYCHYKWGLNISNKIQFHTWPKTMKKYWLENNDIYIEKIFSEKPNRWYWNDLLKSIMNYANENNKNIVLRPRAEKRLNQKQLIEWYERNWFIMMDLEYEMMYRKPDNI